MACTLKLMRSQGIDLNLTNEPIIKKDYLILND